MPPSLTPVVRPLSDASSDFDDKATTAALPSAPNHASQPPPDSHAPPASAEKLPTDSLNPDITTTAAPTDFSCGTWRPHYSPSLKFLFAIVVMIVWPWVFYGVVKDRGGIEMNRTMANVVRKHPQDVDYFVTALASAIAFLIGYLFQTSVTKLAQKWVVFEETDIFRLSFFSALKNRSIVWSWGALPSILKSATRLGLVFTVTLYIVAFILVTPGLTALLHPQTLIRSADLIGTEVDFASSSPDCLEWFNNSLILLSSCDWATYNGFDYTTCFGENQLVDALESGRNNILSSSSNDTESITFTQLNGAHFLGPMKGVMPIGPNGLSAFGNLTLPAAASVIPDSYNYTLSLQGFTSKVSCSYDTRSPITLTPTPNNPLISLFDGSCPTGQEVLANTTLYPVFVDPETNNSLGYWACLSSLPDNLESYDVYLRGDGAYADMTGNMTCSISSMHSAIFPVEYKNQTNLFTVDDTSSTSPVSIISPALMRSAINSMGHVIWGSQQFEANFVGESVITFGVKSYKLQPYDRSETYLRLYEAMIQGLLDYQLTYIRLLYSAGSVPRTSTLSSCRRPIIGTVRYGVMGWEVSKKTGAYMIPLTLVTATSLVFILIAMFTIRKLPTFDPTNPISLIVAASGRDFHAAMQQINDPEGTAAWRYQLQYNENQGRFSVMSGARAPTQDGS